MSILNLIYLCVILNSNKIKLGRENQSLLRVWDCEIQPRGHNLRSVTVNPQPRHGIEHDTTRIHNAKVLFISDIYNKRWLTPSLKICIPYFNSDCTIKYIIEKRQIGLHFICKLGKTTQFYLNLFKCCRYGWNSQLLVLHIVRQKNLHCCLTQTHLYHTGDGARKKEIKKNQARSSPWMFFIVNTKHPVRNR